MKQPVISLCKDHSFKISGQMTFATVTALWLRGCDLIKKHDNLIFDLKEVDHFDSVFLALLTAWIRQARRLNKVIKFRHIPKKLRAISELSGVNDMLVQWID